MGLLEDGYGRFMAKERSFNDGLQLCGATISAVRLSDNRQVDYEGSTENGNGHAELDALCQFLKAIGWDADTYASGYLLQITCTAKPCCVHCSAIMGLLGIAPGHDTYKVNKRMGISYAIPPALRLFLAKALKVTERRVMEELQS